MFKKGDVVKCIESPRNSWTYLGGVRKGDICHVTLVAHTGSIKVAEFVSSNYFMDPDHFTLYKATNEERMKERRKQLCK